jgi:hypothetical protein
LFWHVLAEITALLPTIPIRANTPKVYGMKKKAIAPMASIPGLNRVYIVFSPGEIE